MVLSWSSAGLVYTSVLPPVDPFMRGGLLVSRRGNSVGEHVD